MIFAPIWSCPRWYLLFLLVITSSACGATDVNPETSPSRPNILWIVWDTVRADRLSLYGYSKSTTPNLERWADDALVFENVKSAASSTTPSHASMFTGLLPTQHGANNGHPWLNDQLTTLAELLREAGYATYLWAANPHVSKAENFAQGFDHEAHPWDPEYRDEAFRIVKKRLVGDRSSELRQRFKHDKAGPWAIKAAGELAERDLLAWLQERDPKQPYFAFVNYMEAHRPFTPTRSSRSKMMSPEQVEQSYRVDRSWVPMWSYTFGFDEYSDEQLEIMARTYDATLIELDLLFARLLAALEAGGYLEDTVVVLTSDHGEHLGEHHMLDHQYSLYEPLIDVPLIIRYPKRFEPGREKRPVMNYDLFPTLLELASLEPSPTSRGLARSLLDPDPDRERVAEYPSVFEDPQNAVRRRYPDFDPTPWARRLRSLEAGRYKLIWGEDGRHELYDLSLDPAESVNLYAREAREAQRMMRALDAVVEELGSENGSVGSASALDPEHRKRLELLGYAIDEEASSPPGEGRRQGEQQPE